METTGSFDNLADYVPHFQLLARAHARLRHAETRGIVNKSSIIASRANIMPFY